MDKLRKIRRHLWKEHPKINKIAKFESDLVKTNEEIAPETREIVTKNWIFVKFGLLYVSGKLSTYPSPMPTFCPKWEVSVNVA